MINEKKDVKPVDEEMTLSDIVENEEDKKILEPVKPIKTNKGDLPYTFGYITVDQALMRKEPDENSAVVSVLKKNDAVIIDPNGDVGKFCRVTAKISIGYILKSQFIIK